MQDRAIAVDRITELVTCLTDRRDLSARLAVDRSVETEGDFSDALFHVAAALVALREPDETATASA